MLIHVFLSYGMIDYWFLWDGGNWFLLGLWRLVGIGMISLLGRV